MAKAQPSWKHPHLSVIIGTIHECYPTWTDNSWFHCFNPLHIYVYIDVYIYVYIYRHIYICTHSSTYTDTLHRIALRCIHHMTCIACTHTCSETSYRIVDVECIGRAKNTPVKPNRRNENIYMGLWWPPAAT